MKRWLSHCVLVLAAFFCSALAGAATPKTPALSVATLNGGKFELAAQRGKWVIVNFWATWCSPCIKEMPDLSALVERRPDVSAIGIEIGDEEKDDIVAFVAKHPVKYPIAILPIDSPPKDFGSPKGLPTTFLIAPDGTLAKKFTGPVTSAEIEKAMAAGAAVKKA